MTRVIFLGTPDFSVRVLQSLVDHPDLNVVGVVTQPDRPAGRGQHLIASAVKRHAERLGLPIFQPETLREPAAVERLRSWEPDIIVVAAFGQILRKPVLDLTPHGCINVHASLLPRWRGAAPIQYAIRAGDAETGITVMKMDPGLDTGPMLGQRAIPIAPDETGATLHDRLASLGAEMLPGVLTAYLAGDLAPRPQPEEGVTLAPSLKKAEGQIDWSKAAVQVDRLVRAFDPWPGTYTMLHGELLKIIKGSPQPERSLDLAPGTLAIMEGSLAIQTGDGLYIPSEVQPAGKKPMSSQAFLAGHPTIAGAVLDAPPDLSEGATRLPML